MEAEKNNPVLQDATEMTRCGCAWAEDGNFWMDPNCPLHSFPMQHQEETNIPHPPHLAGANASGEVL